MKVKVSDAARYATASVVILLLSFCAIATEPSYPGDVTEWQEIPVPAETNRGAHNVWFYAANRSNYSWRVLSKDGKTYAQLDRSASEEHGTQPSFKPQVADFGGKSATVRATPVEDGWLVGFDRGEFGAALYWFSPDGKRKYKISNHQVVNFFSRDGNVYAIEGLAHITISRGSLIRVFRPKSGARWRADSVVRLPAKPYVVSLRRDGTMLITLLDSLVALDKDLKVEPVISNAPWGGLSPRSSVLSQDERKLFIGMRQYVGEVDLATKKLRLLVPSSQFVNKLPKEEEEQIRRQ